MKATWEIGASADRGASLTEMRVNVSRPCRVLVVDDDPLVRTRLCALLNAAMYQVDAAASGAEALQILDTANYQIVLTDWEMPDMDGLALCRHVRLQNRDPYVYIVVLTIRDEGPDLLMGLAAGADDYVVKGVAVDEMMARLEIGRRISQITAPPSDHDQDTAAKDFVTGAHSLNYLMQHLPREWARSLRYGHSLAVLNCHIDGFDRFADRFGRGAADAQLRAFVSSAEAAIRTSDWLARTIRDSFMIVLPETPAAGAYRAAEKLSALFAVHPLSTPAAPLGFTVAVDVTSVDGKRHAQSATQIDSLLRRAACGMPGDRLITNEPPDRLESPSADAPTVRRNGLN